MLLLVTYKVIFSPGHQNAQHRSQQHLVCVLRDHHRLLVLLRIRQSLLRRNMRHQHIQAGHMDDHTCSHGLTLLPRSQPDWADFRKHHGEPLDSHHRNRNDSHRTLDSVY